MTKMIMDNVNPKIRKILIT